MKEASTYNCCNKEFIVKIAGSTCIPSLIFLHNSTSEYYFIQCAQGPTYSTTKKRWIFSMGL